MTGTSLLAAEDGSISMAALKSLATSFSTKRNVIAAKEILRPTAPGDVSVVLHRDLWSSVCH